MVNLQLDVQLFVLYDATDGEVLFKGENVHGKKSKAELKKFNRKMQMIFQDPYASLNPRMTVKKSLLKALIFMVLLKIKKNVKNEFMNY